jgi:hypothetical protein
MSLKILAAGTFTAEELGGFPVPPAWRKATRNMIMTTASVERALKQIPGLNIAGDPSVAFVLASTSGELDTSADFMATWAKSRMARPVLFQNSLHNATTGFAAIHFKITGPVFTMSSLEASPQECLETADILLKEKSCRVCIVTVSEGHKVLAGLIGCSESVREGACTLVVTDAANAAALGVKPIAELPENLKSLNYTRQTKSLPLVSIENSGFFALVSELGAAK